MENKLQDSRVRKDLKCLSLGEIAYSMAKELAQSNSLSVSAYMRILIKKQYQRFKQKESKLGGEITE